MIDRLKHKKIIFIILLAFIIIRPNMTVKADDIIPASEFEDASFYQYIISEFDANGDGVLQLSEAEAVSSVLCQNITVTSIKGIEHFHNLTTLWIGTGDDSLKSIEWIEGLTKLESLNLYTPGVRDIGVLGSLKLKNLVLLELSGVTDFSVIAGQTELEYLYIKGSDITDISIIDNLELQSLGLAYCKNITDFSPISKQTSLTELNIGGTNITDISILDKLRLENLNLSYCQNIMDFTPIASMTGLMSLDLSGTKFADTTLLAEHTNIWNLNLDATEVTDIEFLKDISSLEWLNLSNCTAIEDFTPLRELTKLKTLQLNYVKKIASQVEILSPLINLEEIEIYGSGLEILPDMTAWTKLERVYLSGNRIREEEAAAKLPAHITAAADWRHTTGIDNPEQETVGTIPVQDDTTEAQNNGQTEENITSVQTNNRVITSALDNNISAEGNFEKNICLEGEKIDNIDSYSELIEKISQRMSNIIEINIYDIYLYKNEKRNGRDVRVRIQPAEKVKIMIKIKEIQGVKYNVFRQENDGSLTELSCNVRDGVLSFYSEHFSIFSVVISRLLDEETDERGQTVQNSQTGENGGNESDISEKADASDLTSILNITVNENDGDDKSENSFKQSSKFDNNINNSNNNENIDSKEKEEGGTGGVTGIAIVIAVGAVLLVYDIIKRKKGDYMKNFDINC